MLDVCLLGTGGTMPLPNRFLTSLIARHNGKMFLIDCGEGTQVTLKMLGWGFKQIGVICFTHFHADHISGLPGMLLAIANSERVEPLIIIGPRNVRRVVESLRVIAPELPFPIEYYEIDKENDRFYFEDITISALPVVHRSPCYAYRIDVERQGKFDVPRAQSLNLPVRYWSRLQKGEIIEHEGAEYTPEMVMGPPRKGLAVCYATDLRPSEGLVDFVRESDLFIAEGVYGDDEKGEKAIQHRHSLISESCGVAKRANVSELWLTHFSPSLANPHEYKSFAESIFPNAKIGYDRITKTLVFID